MYYTVFLTSIIFAGNPQNLRVLFSPPQLFKSYQSVYFSTKSNVNGPEQASVARQICW